MRTKHSINLKEISEQCFAAKPADTCAITIPQLETCGTWKCPLYKPKSCKDWIRIEDRDGVNLIPPEEYACERLNQKKSLGVPTFRITRVRRAE